MSLKSHLSSTNTLPLAMQQVTSNKVNLILKFLTTKKASGKDKILTKLFMLATNFLPTPLPIAINKSRFV